MNDTVDVLRGVIAVALAPRKDPVLEADFFLVADCALCVGELLRVSEGVCPSVAVHLRKAELDWVTVRVLLRVPDRINDVDTVTLIWLVCDSVKVSEVRRVTDVAMVSDKVSTVDRDVVLEVDNNTVRVNGIKELTEVVCDTFPLDRVPVLGDRVRDTEIVFQYEFVSEGDAVLLLWEATMVGVAPPSSVRVLCSNKVLLLLLL